MAKFSLNVVSACSISPICSRLSCSAWVSSVRIGSASFCRNESGVGSCARPDAAVSDPREMRRIGVDVCLGVDMAVDLATRRVRIAC